MNYETQILERLKNYTVGGTIHIILNNQQGPNSNPEEKLSNYYPTQIANLNQNFVIHVNANDPELIDFVIQLAVEYR